jgi:uncharacterized protein with HEPN domain
LKREYRLYIQDILDAIEKIEEFAGFLTYDGFLNDDKTRSAVVRKLEVIGEAAKNVPESIKHKHEAIPWKEMAKMRDKISHDYFGVDYEIVWKVLKEKLPPLKPRIQKVLAEIDGGK